MLVSSIHHQKMSSSSCLTGSGRVYGLDLDIMLIKSPSLSSTASTITTSSFSSSPTLSESGGNSPFTISTRKPRTPRKRPNQTYNEAAALLSTAYPKIFTKPTKFTKSFFLANSNSGSSSDLLIPLRVDNPGFLLQPPIVSEKSKFPPIEPTRGRSPVELEVDSPENFETEWMLDGDGIEQGIDSIMGNSNNQAANYLCNNNNVIGPGLCYGYPIGWGMEKEYSCNSHHQWRLLNRAAALRQTDDNWWRCPRVNVTEISPKLYQTEKSKKNKKKKKKKLLQSIIADDDEKPPSSVAAAIVQHSILQEDEKPNVVNCKPNAGGGLLLKLNHENLLAAWSEGGSPFSDEPPGNETIGNNLHARLAQIDLFGGEREASVLRYKEKRRTRLFSKKIRYQVRKLNADQRPRMKGRFVRRPDSPF